MTALGQSNFLQALGWAVLNSLWQMALLWVVYQIITALLRITRSSQRSFLATSLLFSGFAWFVFTFFQLLAVESADSGYAAFVKMEGNSSVNNWLHSSLPLASVLYLALLILPILNFIRNYRYVQVIRRYGLKKADVEWRMFVQKVSARMGIAKPVQIWMSDFVSTPLTIGYLKPVILLPMAAVNHLSTQQIEAVLLHELSHIKRFDYLLNLVSRIIQTVLYFNPFVKAFAKIIEREREQHCDEIVMQFQYEPLGYASALLTLEKAASRNIQSFAVAAAGGRKNELLNRVESILGIRQKKVFSFNRLAGVMAALLCFIALNALILLSRPASNKNTEQFAQISSPLQMFSDEEETGSRAAETKPRPIINKIENPVAVSTNTPKARTSPENRLGAAALNEAIIPASYSFANELAEVAPTLTAHDEAQIKEAMEASKKVLEEKQWKAVEVTIADVMTQAQKSQVKNLYEKAADRADWVRMEDKLRQAYSQINWTAVNNQLNTALAEIKIDSLRSVYSMALTGLTEIQTELKQNNQKGVPDSGITLTEVELQRKALMKAIETLKALRDRKIIHL